MVEFSTVVNPNQFSVSSTVSPVYRKTHYLDVVINPDDRNVFTKYLVGTRIPILVCEGDDVEWIDIISEREAWNPS